MFDRLMHASPQERGSSCKPPTNPSGCALAETVNRAPCRFFFGVESLRFALPVFLFFFVILAPRAGARPTVSVAAASNLVYALDDLANAFRTTHPDIDLLLSTGASGSLVAQIRHGAPCDVFVSADRDYPQALVDAGLADPASLTVFATGRLALWTTRDALALDSIPHVVREARKLALANPDTAPYGRAAQHLLATLDLTAVAAPKIVLGENITQTAQFVETGHADAGFVALSLVLSPRLKNRGRFLEVPANLHPPLQHAAILTPRGTANPAARRFLEFLRSTTAREILRRHGYAIPEKPNS